MRPESRQGSVLEVAVATLLPALLLTMVVMDLGALSVSRAQLRHAVESAVLAGVGHLDGTQEGVERAVARTVAFASYNQVSGWPVHIDADTVLVGHYDEAAGFVADPDPATADALAVDVRVGDFGVALIGDLFGIRRLQLRAGARARTGSVHAAGGADCFLPLAVPECVLDEVEVYEGTSLVVGVDTVGWATPGGPVTADELVRQLYSPCIGPPAVVGSDAGIQARRVATAVQAVQQIQVDTPLEGPLLLVESRGADGCGDPTTFDKAPITGFVWGRLDQRDDDVFLRLDLSTERRAGNRAGGVEGSPITWQDSHELF